MREIEQKEMSTRKKQLKTLLFHAFSNLYFINTEIIYIHSIYINNTYVLHIHRKICLSISLKYKFKNYLKVFLGLGTIDVSIL